MMIRALGAPVAVAVAATALGLSVAAPASADEKAFLGPLQAKYVFLTPQQLLSAGHKVCQAERNGTTSPDAAKMVQQDLGVSVAASVDIVSAAVINLGC